MARRDSLWCESVNQRRIDHPDRFPHINRDAEPVGRDRRRRARDPRVPYQGTSAAGCSILESFRRFFRRDGATSRNFVPWNDFKGR
jgi:hypothetical protein